MKLPSSHTILPPRYNYFMDNPADKSTANPAPSPRAFAIGAGAVFQTMGGLFVFGSCLTWLLSAWLVPKAAAPVSHWLDFFRGENLSSALMVIVLIVSLVGGLGLLAVGLGLQGERPRSGHAAMFATAFMTVCYVVVAITYLVAVGHILTPLFVLALGLITVFLFMVAGYSASVLRKFPPPADLNVATPEILEEFRQKRLERLKHYEP